MRIKLEITNPPQSEIDVLAAQELVGLVRGWAKSLHKPKNNLEVWVGGLIYFAGQQIGYYNETSGEGIYLNSERAE